MNASWGSLHNPSTVHCISPFPASSLSAWERIFVSLTRSTVLHRAWTEFPTSRKSHLPGSGHQLHGGPMIASPISPLPSLFSFTIIKLLTASHPLFRRRWNLRRRRSSCVRSSSAGSSSHSVKLPSAPSLLCPPTAGLRFVTIGLLLSA